MKTEKKLFSFLQQKTLIFEKPYKNVSFEEFTHLTSLRKRQNYYQVEFFFTLGLYWMHCSYYKYSNSS